jgi:hypothetical protein
MKLEALSSVGVLEVGDYTLPIPAGDDPADACTMESRLVLENPQPFRG